MLKKLCLILLVLSAITHAAQAPIKSAKELTLDVVTRIKPLQAIILGYLNIWDEEKTVGMCATAFAFRPDGRYLAVAGNNIKIYDARSFKQVHEYEPQGSKIHDLTYSPDGTQLAAVLADKTIKIWDAYQLIQSIDSSHKYFATDVTFSPDGKQIASTPIGNVPEIRDASDLKLVHALKGHKDVVTSIVYSPNGQHIATASSDSVIKIWDAQLGTCVNTCQEQTSKTKSPRHLFVKAVYSPNGKYIACCTATHISIWDAQTYTHVYNIPCDEAITSIVFSPHSDFLVGYSEDRNVYMWNATTGVLLNKILVRRSTTDQAHLAFSPNGVYLCVGTICEITFFKNIAIEIKLADENISKTNQTK